jgi:hypothetical protein
MFLESKEWPVRKAGNLTTSLGPQWPVTGQLYLRLLLQSEDGSNSVPYITYRTES